MSRKPMTTDTGIAALVKRLRAMTFDPTVLWRHVVTAREAADALEEAERVMRETSGLVEEYAEDAPRVGLGAYEACARVHKIIANCLARHATGTREPQVDWTKLPPHPFVLSVNADGGALGMKHGDIVRYDIDGRICRFDEALCDGDAFVTWEDGTHGTVKWNHLSPLATGQRKGGDDEQG